MNDNRQLANCEQLPGGETPGSSAVTDLGFLDGVTLGTRRELRGSGLTGEFYELVN